MKASSLLLAVGLALAALGASFALAQDMATSSAHAKVVLDTDKVDTAVSQMDSITQQNAALVEEATAAAQSLSEQSRNMRGFVEVFKLA